jgi:hypothetical protein
MGIGGSGMRWCSGITSLASELRQDIEELVEKDWDKGLEEIDATTTDNASWGRLAGQLCYIF